MKSFKAIIASVRAKSLRQLMFLGMAAAFALALLGFVIYVSMFLSRHLRGALSSDLSQPIPFQRFDMEGFEKLDLIKK